MLQPWNIVGSFLDEHLGTLVEAAEKVPLSKFDASELSKMLSLTGAVLFRGFNVTDNDFESLALSLGGTFISHGAPSRPSISADGMLHLANPGTAALHLHTELGYFPFPPDFLWFHCTNPASAEGATQICDGRAVVNDFSHEFKELFRRRKLKYSAFWPKDQWERYFQSTSKAEVSTSLSKMPNVVFSFRGDRLFLDYIVDAFHTNSEGQLEFANSMLHYCADGFSDFLMLDDDSPIPTAVVQEALKVCQTHTKEVCWLKNDLLVLDNTRVMHGRKSHSDPNRRLTVRMQRLANT